MGWAENIRWVEKPDDSPSKGEGWCPKENINEEKGQMKKKIIKWRSRMKSRHKNEMKIKNDN